ncbi:hypothetical protein DYT72_17885 [Escherichia coli]|nr:hypothetical protein [Escherichia coli]EFO0739889.1 hypothetical protein [Escherichia coli]
MIYQTVTSLTYVFVPLDFRPLIGLWGCGERCHLSHVVCDFGVIPYANAFFVGAKNSKPRLSGCG